MQAWVRLGPIESIKVSKNAFDLIDTKARTPFLASVQIRPAEVFLNSDGNLCACQYVIFPADALDGMLPLQSEKLRELVHADILKEIDRRRQGGKQRPWNDLQNKLTKDSEKIGTLGVPSHFYSCLDNQSLRFLVAAETPFAIHRKRLQCSLRVKLSSGDRSQLVTTLAMLKNVLIKEIETGRDSNGDKKRFLDDWSLMQFADADGFFTVSWNLEQNLEKHYSTNAARKKLSEPPVLTETDRIALQNTVAAIRREGMPIDPKLTVENVLVKFEKDTSFFPNAKFPNANDGDPQSKWGLLMWFGVLSVVVAGSAVLIWFIAYIIRAKSTHPTSVAANASNSTIEGWYVAIGSRNLGPFTLPQLRQMTSNGQLLPNDMVIQEGTSTPMPAASIAGLIPVAQLLERPLPGPSAADAEGTAE